MPKIYAACGAAGFALSFVVGIFSGASLLLVLARALVFGAVFAGLAVLFNFLLRRFVPDLFDKDAASEPASKPSPMPMPKSRGGKLDITISDEGDAAPEDEDFSVPDFMKDRSRGKPAAPAASAAAGAGEDAAAGAPADEGAQGGDEPALDGEMPAVPAPDSGQDQQADGGGALADMPDASEFVEEDEFGGGLAADDNGGDPQDSEPPRPAATRRPAPSVSASGVDAETMAKAIRTVLSKKDD